MNPNPLSDREKALENKYIKEKEKQMAKVRAEKKQQSAKDADHGSMGQQQKREEPK
ncbi:uncharacterized protein P884DRAFT_277624 [Thermothelomyces heterothallicus CBS 202.75]|uniref:uncharacterized protein n=1 Tax=Thermothelomyces heterothallicus CBS 202.75 TaxID=1149848 RepID=UPI00374318A1